MASLISSNRYIARSSNSLNAQSKIARDLYKMDRIFYCSDGSNLAIMFSCEDVKDIKKIVLKNGSCSTDHLVKILGLERMLHKWYIRSWTSKNIETSCFNSCI